MTRFTKYWTTEAAQKFNLNSPSTYGAIFVGWDSRTQGDAATEATESHDLGQRMSATTAAIFDKLDPGERICRDGIVYAYD